MYHLVCDPVESFDLIQRPESDAKRYDRSREGDRIERTMIDTMKNCGACLRDTYERPAISAKRSTIDPPVSDQIGKVCTPLRKKASRRPRDHIDKWATALQLTIEKRSRKGNREKYAVSSTLADALVRNVMVHTHKLPPRRSVASCAWVIDPRIRARRLTVAQFDLSSLDRRWDHSERA